jgi:hypothetical protein
MVICFTAAVWVVSMSASSFVFGTFRTEKHSFKSERLIIENSTCHSSVEGTGKMEHKSTGVDLDPFILCFNLVH